MAVPVIATLKRESNWPFTAELISVHTLESRRLALSHQLATLDSTNTLPQSQNRTALVDDAGLLANLFTRNQQSDLKSLEKLHRLAGITLFIPNNPNEGSISQDGKEDEFLGIRFETMQDGISFKCLV